MSHSPHSSWLEELRGENQLETIETCSYEITVTWARVMIVGDDEKWSNLGSILQINWMHCERKMRSQC